MNFIDIDFLRKLINPPRCAGCGERMSAFSNHIQAFCPDCRARWERLKRRACAKCGRENAECLCSVRNLKVRALSIVKFGVEGSADRFIYALKNRRNKTYFDFATDELCKRLKKEEMLRFDDFSEAVFTNVPRNLRTKSSIGFDHAELMARGVAEKMNAEYMPLLRRNLGGRTQKKLSISERSRNVKGRFVFDEKMNIEGKTVVLIDDVITTGATVSECVKAIRGGKAREIVILSLARTTKEKK